MNTHNHFPQNQLDKLLHAVSLTAELSQQSAPFSVCLNFLGDSQLSSDETEFFSGRQPGENVFSREVCLCLDEKPVVSARSVCLSDSAYWRKILDCGTRSLGAQLFGGEIPALQRTPFSFSTLPTEHHLVAYYATQPCLARRSVFSVGTGDILLLTECFLPALHRYEF